MESEQTPSGAKDLDRIRQKRPADTLMYRVPLDDDREAQLWLPHRLSASDAKRLLQFFKSLVVDPRG